MENIQNDVQEKNILDVITPVFREVFEDQELVITRNLSAQDVPNWDSLNHITLVVELEQVTGTTFSSEELSSMITVGDLIDSLKSKGLGKV